MKGALLKKTKTQLLDLMKIQGEVSVDEATDSLRLAKTTVRQHLLLLERQGLITSGRRKRSKGRPQLVYRLSESAHSLFPSQEPRLLRELLVRLMEDGKKEWVDNFFREYWNQRIAKFQERLLSAPKKSQASARQVLLELLKEEGFMPEIIKKGDGLVIRECNCPFSQAVQATKIPCRLEAEFLKIALQMDVERISYLPAGSTTCTYRAVKPST